MRNSSRLSVLLASTTLLCANANALELKSVVSPVQADTVVRSLIKLAPKGTRVSNISIAGSFTTSENDYAVNENNYLTSIDAGPVTFRFVIYVGVLPTLSDTVTMRLAANFQDGDCNNPQITVAETSGTNALMDGKIRSYVREHAVELMRDSLVKQTDLVKYCRVQPALEFDVNFL